MAQRKQAATDGGQVLEQQVRDTILTLTSVRRWNQSELARRTGIGRSNLNGKLSSAAETKLTIPELWAIAEALGVDFKILFDPPAEAAVWMLQNRPVAPAAPVAPVVPMRRRAASGQATRSKRTAGGRARAADRRLQGAAPHDRRGQLPVNYAPARHLRVVPLAG